MADYSPFVKTADTMLKSYGSAGFYESIRVSANQDKPWEPETSTTTSSQITYVTFPNDGITFKDANVSEDSRIALVTPLVGIVPAVGDNLVNTRGSKFSVKSAKVINPDDSEKDILWILLVQ